MDTYIYKCPNCDSGLEYDAKTHIFHCDYCRSDFTAEELQHLKLRIGVEKRGRYQGGVALYGTGFGNYNQDIHVRVHYTGAE